MKRPVSISIYAGVASYQVAVMVDTDIVDISQELLCFGKALENGGGIYETRVGIYETRVDTQRNVIYPYPTVQQKPDWTCGCGTTLHGDEAVCWRCGAKAKT